MRALLLAVTVTFVTAGCGSTVALESSTPDEPVTVDASLAEWPGKLQRIDGENLSVGVQNDGDYLYVSMSTRDLRKIGQIMQQGMVLWIDPAGGKAETFGLRYPVGIAGSEDGGRRLSDDMAANRVRIERSMQEVELIAGDGQRSRRSKDAVPGILLHAEVDQSLFTYEARIPLAPGEGIIYAIGTEPGRTIGVGLTTPEMEGQNLAQQPGSGGLPAGTLSSADGRGRYGSQSGRAPISTLPASMSHWLTVTLVAGP
ncbi:MAG: hypothetical protein WD021_04095 [Rhodothermales bacterium]